MRITPNHITLARIGLIPVFVVALLNSIDSSQSTIIAFIVFAFAAATDGLDGWLARSRKQVTNLGIFLDPLADKLLVMAALVTLVQLNEVAAWVVVVILSREFAVTGLRLVAASEGIVISAQQLGKLKTVFQILMVLALIPPHSPQWLGDVLTWATVAITIISGFDYFWKGRDLLRDTTRVVEDDTDHTPGDAPATLPALTKR
ncbi:MAG: CDP-diacylglycerol--glycerol-3-phosphate 3-phosphatidyltransferase [Thermoleophilia bacterium]|nr:CDP-diacylglycerol--glycerol-3-phosphate 3-phosphatidyltransferase [Thermoleophilia bacterium]